MLQTLLCLLSIATLVLCGCSLPYRVTHQWEGAQAEYEALPEAEKADLQPAFADIAKNAFSLEARRTAVDYLTLPDELAIVASQEDDWDLRDAAFLKLPEDHPFKQIYYAEIAQNDANPGVRYAAAIKVTDRKLLEVLAERNTTPEVAALARKKLAAAEPSPTTETPTDTPTETATDTPVGEPPKPDTTPSKDVPPPKKTPTTSKGSSSSASTQHPTPTPDASKTTPPTPVEPSTLREDSAKTSTAVTKEAPLPPTPPAVDKALTYLIDPMTNEAFITKCDTQRAGVLILPETIDGVPVTGIAWEAFSSCSNLTSVTLPKHLKMIGERAFRGCANLSAINFPEGLETIGPFAFAWCPKLTTVTFPPTLKELGAKVFLGSFELKRVVFQGPPPKTTNDPSNFPDAAGFYTAPHAAAWQAVLGDETGRWNGLKMQPLEASTTRVSSVAWVLLIATIISFIALLIAAIIIFKKKAPTTIPENPTDEPTDPTPEPSPESPAETSPETPSESSPETPSESSAETSPETSSESPAQ